MGAALPTRASVALRIIMLAAVAVATPPIEEERQGPRTPRDGVTVLFQQQPFRQQCAISAGQRQTFQPARRCHRTRQQVHSQSSSDIQLPISRAGSAHDDSQKLMHERMMFLLVTLVGNPVTVTVKGSTSFFGIFSAANTEGGELSVALASAQQILPAKDQGFSPQLGEFKTSLLINYKDLESIQAAEVRLQDQAKEMREAREKEAFRTDTEISKAFDPLGSGRTLQRWSDDPDWPTSTIWAANRQLGSFR